MKKNLLLMMVTLVIVPQVTFAAWWNPFTWKIFIRTEEVRVEQPAIPEAKTAPAPLVIEENKEAVESSSVVPVSKHASNSAAQTPKIVVPTSPVAPVLVSTKQATKDTLYLVTKVVDGDTLAINMDGTTETLRLIGIDTPETVDPRKPVQCFGLEASAKAKSILLGKSVRIESDPTQGARDKYGRLLAYVYLADGTSVNNLMIAEGYAHEYTYNIPYKYQAEYKQSQKYAQTQLKGLWAPNVCDIAATPLATTPAPVVLVPVPATHVGDYNCTSNVYNCTDFTTHNEAQLVYESCGGITNDIHRLDGDKDGSVCENLP